MHLKNLTYVFFGAAFVSFLNSLNMYFGGIKMTAGHQLVGGIIFFAFMIGWAWFFEEEKGC